MDAQLDAALGAGAGGCSEELPSVGLGVALGSALAAGPSDAADVGLVGTAPELDRPCAPPAAVLVDCDCCGPKVVDAS